MLPCGCDATSSEIVGLQHKRPWAWGSGITRSSLVIPASSIYLKVFNAFEVQRKCALFSSPGGKYLTTLHGPFQNGSLATKLPTRWSETRFAGPSAEGSWNQYCQTPLILATVPLPTLLFWIPATTTNAQQSSWAYTSDGVAESSGSAWQGAKSSASVDILAPTQLHLVHNLNSYHTTLESQ